MGYENGVAIQFKKNSNGIWEIQKNYGDLEIGEIFSCEYFGSFAVMGGDDFKLRFINMENQEIFGEPLETAIKMIGSLKFCEISKKKTLLVICGVGSDYSNSSDLLDASELVGENDLLESGSESETRPSPSKTKTSCQCISPLILNNVLAKVEHYIGEIFGKLLRQIQRKSMQMTKLNDKSMVAQQIN